VSSSELKSPKKSWPRRSAPYAWQCFACEASNPPGTDLCAACGFPARATGKQIDAAHAKRTTAPAPIVLAERSATDSFFQALSPLPMWRQALIVVGGSLCLGGALWLKFAMSLAGVTWGLGALALGVVVLALLRIGGDLTPG